MKIIKEAKFLNLAPVYLTFSIEKFYFIGGIAVAALQQIFFTVSAYLI